MPLTGHLAEDGIGYAYSFDNKLIAIFYDDGDGIQQQDEDTIAEYVRDGLNRRIEFVDYVSEANDVTTRYYHDGANAVVEYVDDEGEGSCLLGRGCPQISPMTNMRAGRSSTPA